MKIHSYLPKSQMSVTQSPDSTTTEKISKNSPTKSVEPKPELEKNSSVLLNVTPKGRLFQEALNAAKQSPDIRWDRVQELKTLIQEGRYQPDWDQVADKLLSEHLLMDIAQE